MRYTCTVLVVPKPVVTGFRTVLFERVFAPFSSRYRQESCLNKSKDFSLVLLLNLGLSFRGRKVVILTR